MNSIICQHEDPCQSESQTDDHLESENNAADNATGCHGGINSGIKSEETDGTGDCGDTEIAQDILVNFSKKTLTDFNRNESTTWPNRNRNNGDNGENCSNDHPKSEFDDDNDGYSHSSSSNSASDSSEDDSSNSSDSSDDDSEIEMEGTDDKHNEHSNLSEYERLRLRNIQRNEARLAQLGLLVPNSKEKSVGVSENTATENDNGESMSSSLTSLLLTNSKSSSSKQKQKQRKKKPNHAIVKARSQPRRRAKRSRKRKRANIQKSYFKFHFNTDDDSGSDGDSECSDDSDESSMPSPIRLTKVLLPRGGTTQTIVTESSKATTSEKPYASLPRRSRGRPRREEYVYMCDEVCFHCGGEWKINDGNANNDGNSIDGSCDDGYSELLRCKDCREAFHPHCMMVHGNVDSDCEDITDDCGDIDVPDKNEDCTSAADDFDAGIASATNHNGDSSMKNADNSSIVDETCDAAMLLLNMSTMRNSRTSAAASSIEKIGTVLQADCNENGEESSNSKSDLELVLKSSKEGTRSSSGVADRVDLSISNGSNVLAGVTSKSADCVIYPLRPPKRCSLCKKQRISSQQTEKQLSGCKRNHQNDQGHNHQELDLPLDKRRRQNEPTSPSSILRLNPTPYKQG